MSLKIPVQTMPNPPPECRPNKDKQGTTRTAEDQNSDIQKKEEPHRRCQRGPNRGTRSVQRRGAINDALNGLGNQNLACCLAQFTNRDSQKEPLVIVHKVEN